MDDDKIQLFKNKHIRKVWDEETQEWLFSVIDVVSVLTDSSNPTDYLKKMRKRDETLGSYIGTNCPQVDMVGEGGKKRKMLVANTEQILHIIQSVSSPKMELFKQWLEHDVNENEMTQLSKNRGEIILYQPDNSVKIDVLLENETVWLNRQQISVLFDRDVKTIGKHINNALKEELSGIPTVANFATVQTEGGRQIVREIEYYNLDMVLSVGYRVKSNRGIQFRIWSNSILKEYLMKGYAIDQRFERLEYRVADHDKKIDFFIKRSLPPIEGIFFKGQIFDAYAFISELIGSAKESIVLLDNYLDASVLLQLSGRSPGVSAVIYTNRISSKLKLDIDKHNAQYDPIQIHESDEFHDRFLIVDHVVYLIDHSLKDIGKKMTAFTKMDLSDRVILDNI